MLHYFSNGKCLTTPGGKERSAIVATVKLYFPVGSLEIYDRRKLLGNTRANGVISDLIDSVNIGIRCEVFTYLTKSNVL